MLNKWALVLNILAFLALGVLLFFQLSEVQAYFDEVGNIGLLFK